MGRTSDAREKLLEAFLRLIWRSSYGAVGVDQICEAAGVGKGSFYYFFASKSELAVAAYEACWESTLPEMEALFSPSEPALVRLSNFCRSLYQEQQKKFVEYGFVVGCPYANVGSELATQDPLIRAKTQEIMDRILGLFAQAITDAISTNVIDNVDSKVAARQVYSVILGELLRAKVENNLGILRDLDASVFRLLGVASATKMNGIGNPT